MDSSQRDELAHAVAAQLRSAGHTAIASHIRPDGDAWSSALGLAGALRRIGRRATVVARDAVPQQLAFLDGATLVARPMDVAESLRPDVLVLVDCATPERAGLLDAGGAELWPGAALVVIDHHENAPPARATALIDPTAPAAAELVFDVVRALAAPMDAQLAETLLTGMLTDTASFQLSTTTPALLRSAALLLEAGADVGKVSGRLFRSRRWEAAALWSRVLASLESHAEGRIACLSVRTDDRTETGGVDSDLDGRAAYLLGIEGVQIGMLFREEPGSQTRVSIRTQGGPSALELARQFGGGGHESSAGCTLRDVSIEAAKSRLVEAATAMLAGR